jgi:hypothetical protein
MLVWVFINKAANSANTRINIQQDSFTLSKPAQTWKQWHFQKNRHYTTSKFYKPLHKFLLGLFSLSHFLFYPAAIAVILIYNWKWAIALIGIRLLMQCIVYTRSLIKLNEKDLIPYILLFDIWMFFYYLVFATSLFKRPKLTWKQ